MVRKELFDKCVGLLEESGLGENAACEVTWLFEDVAEGEDITPEQEKRISDIITRRCPWAGGVLWSAFQGGRGCADTTSGHGNYC